MSRAHVAVVGTIALLTASPARPEPGSGAQAFTFQPPNLFEQKKPAPKAPSVDWKAAPATGEAAGKRSVICGMTVVPVDPTFDAKIRVAPSERPGNRDVTFTMKIVPPPACSTK
jgi:hypothetical protein